MQESFAFCLCLEPAEIVSKGFFQKITTHVTTASSCAEPVPALNLRIHGHSSEPATCSSKWNH